MKILNETPLIVTIEPDLLRDMENRLDVVFYQPKYLSVYNILEKLDWEIKEIKELCKAPIHRGKTPEYTDKGIPVIKTINLKNSEIVLDPLSYVSEKFCEKNEKCVVEKYDILIASTGVGSIGKVDIVESDQRLIVDGHISIIRLDKELVNPYYVLAFLRSKYGQLQIEQRIRGATGQIELYPEDIETIRIPIPRKEIQNKVSDLIINAFKERKQKLKKSEELLEGINRFVLTELGIKLPEIEDKQTYFAELEGGLHKRIDPMFYHPKYIKALEALKNGYFTLFPLGKLSESIASGATPLAKGKDYTSKDKGIPFVRIVDIKNGEISFENVLYIKREIHETMLRRSQLRPMDVLLSIAGTIGITAVVPEHIKEANINQALARIRLKDTIIMNGDKIRLNPYYVSVFLETQIGKILTQRFSRPVVQANINIEEVSAIEIPVPPFTIQEKIANEVMRRKKEAEKLWKESKEITKETMREIENIILGKG
jgi:restriction endonuclease S subunit